MNLQRQHAGTCRLRLTLIGHVHGWLAVDEMLQVISLRDYVVIAQGNHLQHFINGKPTVDVTDECESKAASSGVLALQVHIGLPMTVAFKNLRIKTLTASAA